MNIIMDALGAIDEKYIDEVQNFKRKPNVLKLVLPIAACLVVLSCVALYSLNPPSQSDEVEIESTASIENPVVSESMTNESTVPDKDNSALDGAIDESTQDRFIFKYLGEVVEVFQDNTAIICITQTDLSLEIYDGLFFDVGEEVTVNFAVNSSVNVGDLLEFTNKNYYILEGEIYEINEKNYN